MPSKLWIFKVEWTRNCQGERYLGEVSLVEVFSLGFFNSFWGYCTIPDNRSKSLIEIEEAYQPTPLNMKRKE